MLTTPMVDLLWNLPNELIHNVLASWIDAQDIGHLDSAVCGELVRENFLRAVRAPGFAIRQYESRTLNHKHSCELDDWFAAWIMTRDFRITELTVTGSFVSNRQGRINYLKRHGKQINSILFQHEAAERFTSAAKVMKDLCELCPNVLSLDLCLQFSTKTLAHVANRWKHLTNVRLWVDLDEIRNTEAIRRAGRDLIAFCVNCPALVELSLCGMLPRSVVVEVLRVSSPTLQKIKLPTMLIAGDFEIIGSRYPELRELDVLPCSFDDAALLILATGCPNLSSVPTNAEITDVGIVAVARNGALTTLVLSPNGNVTDVGICAVAANCSLLQSIDLGCSVQFTDAALIAVAEGCPLLEDITLYECASLTAATLVSIVTHCHNLRKLCFWNTNLSRVGLDLVIWACPLLEELTFDRCGKMGPALGAAARGCPRLRCLTASDVDVSPKAVLTLAKCCPLLQDVELDCSARLGDRDVTALARGYPRLRTLNIVGTSVGEKGLRAIREHCKALKRIALEDRMFPGWKCDYAFFPAGVIVAEC
jgi:hypothetical protein